MASKLSLKASTSSGSVKMERISSGGTRSNVATVMMNLMMELAFTGKLRSNKGK